MMSAIARASPSDLSAATSTGRYSAGRVSMGLAIRLIRRHPPDEVPRVSGGEEGPRLHQITRPADAPLAEAVAPGAAAPFAQVDPPGVPHVVLEELVHLAAEGLVADD